MKPTTMKEKAKTNSFIKIKVSFFKCLEVEKEKEDAARNPFRLKPNEIHFCIVYRNRQIKAIILIFINDRDLKLNEFL